MQKGSVILVGAGAGSRDMLTLKGYECLQKADVIVYDRLIDQDILSCVQETAFMVNVGKENNNHPIPQNEINEILVKYAKEGKYVVRLKGGDSFLFGRGGEECEYLAQNGIDFEVVPGVTSGIAAPAYAGIPVTHRDFSSSVHFVTAHAKAGKQLEIDYKSLVSLNGTIVFYMGLGHLEELMSGLIHAGMSQTMPAAVIENGARATQRTIIGNISTITQLSKKANVKSPALIVVGKVCSMATTINWFDKKPLFGKNIVVTRPKERIGTLSKKLRELGANVIECPCIKTVNEVDTEELKSALENGFSWVVLTSPNGVGSMLEALDKIGKDVRVLTHAKFAVIGSGTAKELKKIGINADIIPEVYDSKHLGKMLCEVISTGEKVLILRAKQGSLELTNELKDKNIQFYDIPIYRTEYRYNNAVKLKKWIKNNSVNVVTFTSVSTVDGFVDTLKFDKYNNFTALCIGKQTAEKARFYGMNVLVSKKATIDSMITALEEEVRNV